MLHFVYEVKEDTMLDVLLACNTINNGLKVSKAVVNDDCVWLYYEIVIDSTPVFDDLIPSGIQTLMHAKDAFYNALKE